MKKTRVLLENIFIYGIGSVISKIIPLVLLPVITMLMPNSAYFGVSDLFTTMTSFASAFALLGMYDGLFRMYFEKDSIEYKKTTCSTALMFTLASSAFVFVIMILFRKSLAGFFFKNVEYSYVVVLSAFSVLFGTTNNIVSAPTRMQNKRVTYVVVNTLSPIVSYSIAIIMILNGHYIIAMPIAAIMTRAVTETYYYTINRKWFDFKLFDRKVLKQILIISLPLVPNFLIYWVFNSSDKLMITNLLSLADEGVYSVGAKLGHASQLIYTAFASGWSYFVFSTMKDKNQVRDNSRLAEYLTCIALVATAFVCILSKPVFDILFSEEYNYGFIVSPYLFLAPLVQMVFQIVVSQFTIIKKTWYNMIILTIGAVINVALNFLLIPAVGIEGAAIATLAGYLISLFICLLFLTRMNLIIVSKRIIILFGMFVLYFMIWRLLLLGNLVIGLVISLCFMSIAAFMYRAELQTLLNKCKQIMTKKSKGAKKLE